ncbi:hypothetical protein AB0J14_35470 [Micromonospora arborensis]|uniref:hypothetical protein n=1 Tax=Micromonospora TaxID=1873 RepID=UPI0033EE0C8E
MSEAYDSIRVGKLLEEVRQGVYDVPQFQRMFSRDRGWVEVLMQTLWGSGRIGAALIWQPTDDSERIAGRYRRAPNSALWIVDGQQRITAIAAAFGLQPPWMSTEQWERCGGPLLQMGITNTRGGKPALVRPRQHGPYVSLGAVHGASESEIEGVLAAGNLPTDMGFALQVQEKVRHILDVEVLREWLHSDLEEAYKHFVNRNKKSTQIGLRPEELALSVLAHSFEPLLPDYIDPMIESASKHDLSATISLRRLNHMLQRMLPQTVSGRAAVSAQPAVVEDAADRLKTATDSALRYLAARGLIRDGLISSPSVLNVLVALFDRFQHAQVDDFAFRWIVHTVAGGLQFSRPSIVTTALVAIAQGGSYEDICSRLAALSPPGRPATFPEPRLHVPSRSWQGWGPVGCLYAMASATGTAGTVRDLRDPDVAFPDRRMSLLPLCENAVRGLLIHHAFMSDATAEVIAAHHGWTRHAYDELSPDDAVRAAHQLPIPPKGIKPDEVADWLAKERGPLLARTIDTLLEDIGPLWEENALFPTDRH